MSTPEILRPDSITDTLQRTNSEFTAIDLKKINAGTVNFVFEMGETPEILHINPDFVCEDEMQIVVEPHAAVDKGEALFKRLSGLTLPDFSNDTIAVASNQTRPTGTP